ncbi:uncharacterized protein N0V89_001561 [Didymosphaeria variabile]|uniref:Uncharacterized protein n=1 Tax=Didymosphaeria variabile TaxID=1932322 RepID=A0A9W9CGV0_9PLEO|nr:uncharacterized protein N0V89_001561 [Didymosphaeria variabile]KAJ4360992.1 hypothetical protein N0V89_001561 [Didymosphaeria variabile]
MNTVEHGAASIDADPESNAVVHQQLDNWLLMIRFERMNMMKGPKISISIGDVLIRGIYKRAAMAVSRTLNEHFTMAPHSTHFHFEAGSLEIKAVCTLLISWLRETSKIFEAHEVRFRKRFHTNIAILRAARLLGMERYTNIIMQSYINYVQTEVPYYHEIACVEAMRTSHKDPVWTAMVNHLSHLRYTGQIPDPKTFSKFHRKHPELAGAMYYTDQFFKAKAAEDRRGYPLIKHLICDYETGQKVMVTGKEAAMWWASQL